MEPSYFPIILMLTVIPISQGLYFHIGETEKKCFIEEIPNETRVIGNFKTQLYDKKSNSFMTSSPGIGMHVEIKGPDDDIILSTMYSSEGRFTFTSHTPGEHLICIYSNSTSWAIFGSNKMNWIFRILSQIPLSSLKRVHLDIEVGEHANNDYRAIQEKDNLTDLQLRVRQLLYQVEQMQKEQNYQRYREEHFRHTSESTYQRVLWWSIAQTAILVTGFWQMRHLKGFC